MTQNKNNYPLLIFTILVLFLKSEFCYPQHTVDLTNISLIVYNEKDADLRLFEEKNKNLFIEIYLEFDNNYENIFISTDIEQDNIDDAVALEDIKLYENDILIRIDNLRETNIQNLLKNEFEIKEDWYKYGENTTTLVLKFLNNSISTIQELNFQKKERNGGFGSQVLRKDDNEERWRINYAHYFSTVDLDFGNGKHIYLLLDDDNIDFIFLPLTNNDYLVSDDDGISALKHTSKYKMSYLESFEQFEFDDFISIFKNKNNKYELVSSFKQNLLKVEYDTIMYNQFFTIGKNKKQVDIFNSYYEKIKIDSIKSAYLYRSGLEILNNKGANYYDSELKIIEKFPPIEYLVCGTISETSYEIDYNKLIKTYILTKIDGGFASNLDKKREYYLNNIKRNDKVTFLNNSKEYYWDENDNFVGSKYGYPHLLKITRGKNSGIFEYDYNNTLLSSSDTIPKDWKKQVNFSPYNIKGKVVLTVNNDSITFNKNDGLIYFYRKNKIGIFPRHETVQFQNINQKTNSFYAIIRDEKQGWLDINTNIEYYDD
ncbi:MAG: hypothetical protein ACK5NB_12460 [Flavobacteriaceae bacterium]